MSQDWPNSLEYLPRPCTECGEDAFTRYKAEGYRCPKHMPEWAKMVFRTYPATYVAPDNRERNRRRRRRP